MAGRPLELPLATPRLRLRPFTAGDLDALSAIYGDPQVMRFVGDGTPRGRDQVGESLASMMRLQRDRGFSPWAVIENDTGTLVGESGLCLLDRVGPEIELTYTFARRAWGRGYATEAGAACLDAGFCALGFTRVVAVAEPANVASRHVLEKLGMRECGRGRYYGAELLEYELDHRRWSLIRAAILST